MRGIFTSAFLATIEESTEKPIAAHFDLIVGTSTGGIIALALALGMPASEVLQLYQRLGARVFREFRGLSALAAAWRAARHPRYSEDVLKEALQATFGEALLGEAQTRLVVASFDPQNGDIHLFKTPHHPDVRMDHKALVWQVAMSTAAAPTYFRASLWGRDTWLVDGGLWANNPTLVGIAEATGVLEWHLGELAVLNIGTEPVRTTVSRQAVRGGGWLQWARSNPTTTVLRLQGLSAHRTAETMLRRGHYLRIAPLERPQRARLDDVPEASELVTDAEHLARKHLPTIDRIFLSQRAEPFIRIHRS